MCHATVSLPAVVVGSVNQTPSPNPADTDALLPPMPTEFEVATIKIDKDPQAKENFRFMGGRFDLRAIPMTGLAPTQYVRGARDRSADARSADALAAGQSFDYTIAFLTRWLN